MILGISRICFYSITYMTLFVLLLVKPVGFYRFIVGKPLQVGSSFSIENGFVNRGVGAHQRQRMHAAICVRASTGSLLPCRLHCTIAHAGWRIGGETVARAIRGCVRRHLLTVLGATVACSWLCAGLRCVACAVCSAAGVTHVSRQQPRLSALAESMTSLRRSGNADMSSPGTISRFVASMIKSILILCLCMFVHLNSCNSYHHCLYMHASDFKSNNKFMFHNSFMNCFTHNFTKLL
jgi:hypothetical protein